MKSFFMFISVFLFLSFIFISAASAQVGSNTNDAGEGTSPIDDTDTVTVKLSAGSDWEFRYAVPVDPNGELLGRKLQLAIDINRATIESDRQIRCFLWRHGDSQESRSRDDEIIDLISESFTSTEEFSGSFAQTEKIFCYDESRDRETGNTFTIFIENRRGQTELVRVQIPSIDAPAGAEGDGEERAGFGELDMTAEYPTLGVDVAKAMIVAYPGEKVPQVEEVLQSCLLFTSDRDDPAVVWPNVVTTLAPQTNILRIRCSGQRA